MDLDKLSRYSPVACFLDGGASSDAEDSGGDGRPDEGEAMLAIESYRPVARVHAKPSQDEDHKAGLRDFQKPKLKKLAGRGKQSPNRSIEVQLSELTLWRLEPYYM